MEEKDINIQEIKEIDTSINGDPQFVDLRAERINELIRAVKQLDKQINGKE